MAKSKKWWIGCPGCGHEDVWYKVHTPGPKKDPDRYGQEHDPYWVLEDTDGGNIAIKFCPFCGTGLNKPQEGAPSDTVTI